MLERIRQFGSPPADRASRVNVYQAFTQFETTRKRGELRAERLLVRVIHRNSMACFAITAPFRRSSNEPIGRAQSSMSLFASAPVPARGRRRAPQGVLSPRSHCVKHRIRIQALPAFCRRFTAVIYLNSARSG